MTSRGGDRWAHTVLPPEFAEWEAVIHRTNVTGLGSRADYARVFAAMARESVDEMCAAAPLAKALLDRQIVVADVMFVGGYPPGDDLPAVFQEGLQQIEEVAEATPTQVLNARESDGPDAHLYSVEGRQSAGQLMAALGDTDASRVRNSAWTRSPSGSWQIAASAMQLATVHGMRRDTYEWLSQCPGDVLPAVTAPEVLRITGDRKEDKEEYWEESWITYAEVLGLLKDAP